MNVKATNKFNFRGVWYPTTLVRKAACRYHNLDERLFDTDDKLNELVDYIIKGPPTPCSVFILLLNEGKVK